VITRTKDYGTELTILGGRTNHEVLEKRDREFDETTDDIINMMMMVMMMFIVVSVVPVAQTAQTYYQRQMYVGETVSRVLDVTSVMKFMDFIASEPYVGLITASLHNDGYTVGNVHYPVVVYIGVNNQDELHELRAGEDYHINMAGAGTRIEQIFYKTNPGQSASIRLIGKY